MPPRSHDSATPRVNPLDDPSTDPFDVAQRAAREIADLCGVRQFDMALTLGSGWAAIADSLGDVFATIPASDIVGFAKSASAEHVASQAPRSIPGHIGELKAVKLADGRHVLVMGLRCHLYEGRGVRHVVHSVRTAAACGVTTMILTNGAGGINPELVSGSVALISDHINFTGESPLEGPEFIDMSDTYSAQLRSLVRQVDDSLREGVYIQFRGPQYETPAEIAMARRLGADIVGMSTALEAIAARHLNMNVLGLSLITNAAAGMSAAPLSHEDVLRASENATEYLTQLLRKILSAIS